MSFWRRMGWMGIRMRRRKNKNKNLSDRKERIVM
jgi:hypothetical protein